MTVYDGENGLHSIMSDQEVQMLASLKVEYESNCFVQCKLISVFEEIGLCVVNSERPGFEWLETFSAADKCTKRPDFIICNPAFYEQRAEPDNISTGVLAVQHMLLDQDQTLLYGVKAGHPLRFLDDICIIEGKVDKLQDADVGQMKTYAGLQARLVTNTAFHRLALFNQQTFILFLSRGGEFVSATECKWNTPGSKQLIQNFFDVPSPLVKALKASCEALSVTPCTPRVNWPCILGAGGSGVVFRVSPIVTELTGKCGSTRSETAVMGTRALKVVVGGCPALTHFHREWQSAKIAKTLSTRVITVGNIFVGVGFGAYLMDEVGTAVPTTSLDQKQTLFSALHDLHIRGIVHGDARIQNAILLPDGIKWVDFATAASISSDVRSDVSLLIANDFELLFKSVFGQMPSAAQIEAYMRCVDHKKITWESLDLLNE